MKIYNDITDLYEFTPWSGAKENYNRIIKSANAYHFINDLEEIYPEGISDTQLNDILWFDDEFCFQYIENEYLTAEEIEIKNNY